VDEGEASRRAALRDVTKEIAEDYAASLNGGRLSPNTYNKHLNLLTLMFRVLKDKARLTSNPWEDIQRKRIAAHSRRELTIDELKKVCQAATGELQTLLGLGVYSGLRLGDCATLRWGEVDMPRCMIRRIPNKTARRNPKPVIVPIHPVLRDMLGVTPVDQRGDYVLPEIAALYNRRTDLVTDMVQRHFISCGIKPHKPGTGKDGNRAVVEVGFHSLRHTFVSLCRESNAPLAVVESIVGHSNPAMTRHYTHVGEVAAGKAVAALPAVIGETRQQRDGEESILHEIQRIARASPARIGKRRKPRCWPCSPMKRSKARRLMPDSAALERCVDTLLQWGKLFTVVFVELPAFTRRLFDLLDDESFLGLQIQLAARPEAG